MTGNVSSIVYFFTRSERTLIRSQTAWLDVMVDVTEDVEVVGNKHGLLYTANQFRFHKNPKKCPHALVGK